MPAPALCGAPTAAGKPCRNPATTCLDHPGDVTRRQSAERFPAPGKAGVAAAGAAMGGFPGFPSPPLPPPVFAAVAALLAPARVSLQGLLRALGSTPHDEPIYFLPGGPEEVTSAAAGLRRERRLDLPEVVLDLSDLPQGASPLRPLGAWRGGLLVGPQASGMVIATGVTSLEQEARGALLELARAPLRRVRATGWLPGCVRPPYGPHSEDLVSADFSGLTMGAGVPGGFMAGCPALRNIALPAVRGEIGPDFLAGCWSLGALDLTPLAGATRVGCWFLASCLSLAALDLAPVARACAAGIPEGFLAGCAGLRALDLTPLAAARVVGPGFLQKCCGIRALDLRPLSQLTDIPDLFLSWTGLAVIDLGPLAGAKRLGDGFLSHCPALAALDLTPLVALETIGADFLGSCVSLRALTLPPLPNLRVLPPGFLAECESLNAIDLTPLTGIQGVMGGCLMKCASLKALAVPPWRLDYLGRGFCDDTGLEVVDLSGVVVRGAIGDDFFHTSWHLREIRLPAAQTIGRGMLRQAPRLEELDCAAIPPGAPARVSIQGLFRTLGTARPAWEI